MITLLSKVFIKNYRDYEDSNVRTQYGVICGAFGIFLNVLLFALKFVFGTLAASVAMIADSFNNLSDAASSIVSILGFKLASRKPDPEHPFGHGRLEYVSGLVISFLILLMGKELLADSIDKLVHPVSVQFSIYSVIVMFAAILVKLYMYFYNHSIGKKINSVSMEATAKDSLSDMISTGVVIASLIIGKFVSFPIDGIAGIIVALCIFKTGFEAAKETIEPLLGSSPSEEFVKSIEAEVLKHKPICGMHDLVVHDYGPGRLMISLHAEVPGDMNIFDLHELIDQTEFAITRKFNCHVTIHMDPVDLNNARLSELKNIIECELKKINEDIKFHDVRMVPGVNRTNLIFDVVKPFSCKLTDEVLVSCIQKMILERTGDVYCVITVDRPFV